ncbi:hypothetical protein ERJ75_001608400 [Trypanosoma vivax]|uniref:Uncharacterized protein n=1 Tax=Trypanosoma vivax (strain Y486) TaxID=1055687 RepID=G0TSV0_TRYVY|nr:hypothetical protein TRVL_09245 [Trypanosoma vivax]KAH8605713.1 hypothetical protein ERJ75_001608400 [Trypanosoma vivax]CCC47029.1 conserved hypothetical protein [Trypanosoma vivax Y486]
MFRGMLNVGLQQQRSKRRLAIVASAEARRTTPKLHCRANMAIPRPLGVTSDIQGSGRKVSCFAAGCERASGPSSFHPGTAGSGHRSRFARAGQATGHTTVTYDSVDDRSGVSVVQKRFDALAREAVLKFGPPYPPEFVLENDVVVVVPPGCSSFRCSGEIDPREEDNEFFDEVQIRLQELFHMVRKVDPSFSVRTHADSVPFSLLVKNCLYFKAERGRLHFMRCLRRLSPGRRGVEGSDPVHSGPAEVEVTLAKYKMREPPSFDGIRQGPQPWLYHYKMV